MALKPGSQLGSYRIVDLLGVGGMGEVYRALDPRLDREVAIKVLPEGLSGDPGRLRRFEQEAKAAGALNHPNILAVYDIGSHEGCPYVVTELLEGETLRELLGEGPVSPRKVMEYGVQVADGLAAAHAKNIVHRDLKPENLFLTRDGRVKILDFGLAKVTRPEGPLDHSAATVSMDGATGPGTVLGTVGYMSPEQVRGESVDHRTDIFAFGAVLYELAFGQRAFQGDSAVEVLNAILKEDPTEIAVQGQGLPPALSTIMRRCLEKRPEERFQGAHDLGLALEAGILQSDSSQRSPEAVPAGRWRWFAGLAGAVVVLALLQVGVQVTRDRPEADDSVAGPGIESLAVLPLENLSGDPDQDYFADGMTEAIIANLGQIGTLKVISRTSVMGYKGTTRPLPEIAAELKVDAIVEGSVIRVGDSVRITTQVVDGATDHHLWAESFDGSLEDVLALQSHVAREIALGIDERLVPSEKEEMTPRRVAPEAYDLFLKARWQLFQGTATPEDIIGLMETAIDLDPGFALARAWLADYYGFLAMTSPMPPGKAYLQARQQAQKAVELDPDSAYARASMGRVYFQFEWNWPAAEEELLRAVELDPNTVESLELYGAFLVTIRGRCDLGLPVLKESVDRDPFNPETYFNHAIYSFHCRRWDESISLLERAMELAPGFTHSRLPMAWAYQFKGMADRAAALCDEEMEALGGAFDMRPYAGCVGVYADAGREDEAKRLLRALEDPPDSQVVDGGWMGFAYMGIGDHEKAVEQWERAYRERSSNMFFVRTAPALDPLRDHPRFQAVIEKMGFPDDS